MKIFHTICAAFMAATIASCDAHQDFPDKKRILKVLDMQSI